MYKLVCFHLDLKFELIIWNCGPRGVLSSILISYGDLMVLSCWNVSLKIL